MNPTLLVLCTSGPGLESGPTRAPSPRRFRPRVRASDPLLLPLRRPSPPPCPHCAARRIQRWGRFGFRQRYRCLHCARTFSELTGTALHGLRRAELWPEFGRCMIEGLSVRRAAARLGVHRDTAFRWRHRFLRELRRAETHPVGPLLNVDESFVTPGTWILLGLDSRGRALGRLVGDRRADPPTVAALVDDRIDRDVTLLSGEGRLGAVGRFARAGRLLWAQRVAVDPRYDPLIEPVRLYARRFRRWLSRFRGIAVHYVDNYLAWFRLVDGSLWNGVCGIDGPRTRAPRPPPAAGSDGGATALHYSGRWSGLASGAGGHRVQ